jgi:hypothetical protein
MARATARIEMPASGCQMRLHQDQKGPHMLLSASPTVPRRLGCGLCLRRASQRDHPQNEGSQGHALIGRRNRDSDKCTKVQFGRLLLS